jgi:hypothetical protein
MTSNPLLDEFLALDDGALQSSTARELLIARYSFAIPSDEALDGILASAPSGVVEVGAGTGYWAKLLSDRGGHVRAYDPAPPGSPENRWFAGSSAWFDVQQGDESVAATAPPATLLLIWPTRNEAWPLSSVQRFHAAGGDTLIYVGEGPGGRTGDDSYHASLGEMAWCNQCAYGLQDSPCICEVSSLWQRSNEISIPTWPGYHDTVRFYRRRSMGRVRRLISRPHAEPSRTNGARRN